jgi:hypothetical protein
MEMETLERFNREMRSFQALIILNIAGAGLAMSFGVSTIIQNLTPLFSGNVPGIQQVAMAGLMLVGCAFAIRWLIKGAEVLSRFDELKSFGDLEQASDVITGKIVSTMAWYREQRLMINQLKLGSMITGAFFLVSATLQLVNLAQNLSSPGLILMSIVGLGLCLTLGAAGILIPRYITRFGEAWDKRVEASGVAEKKLDDIMDGRLV